MAVTALPVEGSPVASHRRALFAACAGNAVEWYDFALFGAAATVLAAVLSPGGWAGLITVFSVFAASCLFRPLGSLLIGARADRSGRRPVLAGTILLMAFATFAIGLLPPWSVIGLAAPLSLLGLRAAQAFSAGGEIGVSVAYLTEIRPPERRGRTGGWYLSSLACGLALGLGVTALVTGLLDAQELAAWGWRIPFLLALPLGGVGWYLRRRVAESPLFVPAQQRVSPRSVWRSHRSTVLRCFLLAGAYSAVFNVWFVFLPAYLTTTDVSPLPWSLAGALFGLSALAIAAPMFGKIADRVGRRPVLIGATMAIAVTIVPLYSWILSGSTSALLIGNGVIGAIAAAFVLPAFLAEQFPNRVRATGIGLAYGIGSAVIGGTAPLLATVLSRQTPALVPGYLVMWAILGLLAVVFSSETFGPRSRTMGRSFPTIPDPGAAHRPPT
jgi:MHS family proline/betaine transporter-like MFS transporter